jgi:hypothetical protein
MRCEHTKEKKLAFVSFLKKMKKKNTKKRAKKKKRKERGKKGGKPESNKKRVAKNLRSQIIRRCVFQSNENE